MTKMYGRERPSGRDWVPVSVRAPITLFFHGNYNLTHCILYFDFIYFFWLGAQPFKMRTANCSYQEDEDLGTVSQQGFQRGCATEKVGRGDGGGSLGRCF